MSGRGKASNRSSVAEWGVSPDRKKGGGEFTQSWAANWAALAVAGWRGGTRRDTRWLPPGGLCAWSTRQRERVAADGPIKRQWCTIKWWRPADSQVVCPGFASRTTSVHGPLLDRLRSRRASATRLLGTQTCVCFLTCRHAALHPRSVQLSPHTPYPATTTHPHGPRPLQSIYLTDSLQPRPAPFDELGELWCTREHPPTHPQGGCPAAASLAHPHLPRCVRAGVRRRACRSPAGPRARGCRGASSSEGSVVGEAA